ncbi:MAG TPA: hypothetical protein VFP84_09795 [Kofleriaceae bacterium]|nr:hypothetical protein [Kofleriaceae bacterium]
MPSQDTVDPVVAEADRRAERAKASLLERVEKLKHKLNDAKHSLDVPAHIAQHPWPAVGVAFALGVAAGFGRKSPPAPAWGKAKETRTMRDMVITAAVSLGMKVVRDAVLGQLTDIAKQWWTQRANELAVSEARTGQRGDLEPFLEH